MMKTPNYIRLLLTSLVNQLVNTKRVILVSYVLHSFICLEVEPQDIEIIKSCKKVETSAWGHRPSYLSLDVLGHDVFRRTLRFENIGHKDFKA